MPDSRIETISNYLSDDLQQVKDLVGNYCQCNLPEASEVLGLLRDRNGKMIRPMLVLLSGKAYGSLSKDHYIIAAVIEMIHVASLLHDDVLDGADTRRYQPSLNKLVGNKAAVLAGDLLLSIALSAAIDLENQGDLNDVVKIVSDICEGELAQQRTSGKQLTEEQYIDIVSKKTASLLACCIERGAFLSGATPEQCQEAFQMGQKFGIAFQIMDDLRDIVSQELVSGKTVGTDFMLGKLTLPLIHHMSIAGDNVLGWLSEASSGGFTSEVKNELLDRLDRTGSVDYCKSKVLQLSDELKTFVNNLNDEALRDVYNMLLNAVVSV